MSWDDDWEEPPRRRNPDQSRSNERRPSKNNGWQSQGFDSWDDYDPLDDPEADPFSTPPRNVQRGFTDAPPPPSTGDDTQPRQRGENIYSDLNVPEVRRPSRSRSQMPERSGRPRQRSNAEDPNRSRSQRSQARGSNRQYDDRQQNNRGRQRTERTQRQSQERQRRPSPTRSAVASNQSRRRPRERQDYMRAEFYERWDPATYEPIEENATVERARNAGEWVVVIAAAIAMALLVQAFVLQQVYIPSGSMIPTIQKLDRVLVNKLAYKVGDVSKGDIVVFHPPAEVAEDSDKFIKRVMATEGDVIGAENGAVYVNGEFVDEPYLPEGVVTADFGPVEIPKGQMFVMGDNRGNSEDSRDFGPVPTSSLVGQGFLRVYPLSKIGFL